MKGSQHLPPGLLEPANVRHKNVLDKNHLTSRTQKAAFNLLQREDNNAKKSRLESLLQHQFIGKYGTKNPDTSINSTIRECISDFLSSFVNTRDAEAQISTLEDEIRSKTESIKNTVREARRLEKKAAEDAKRELAEKQQQQQFGASGKLRLRKGEDPREALSHLTEDEMPLVVNALRTVEEERKRQEELKQAELKKKKLREALDQQLATHQALHNQDEELKHQQLHHVNADVEAFRSEQIQQRIQREQRLHQEREMRKLQIEEIKRRKEIDRQTRIAQEKAEIARAQRLMEEEEEERQRQRQRQRANQDRLFMENELNKRIKEQSLREAQEAEKRLNREYEKKLEEEDYARANAFRVRMDALQKFQNSYEAKVGTKLQQQREDDERAILQALQERERQEEERERQNQENRRKRLQQSMEDNLRMMEAKQREKERERMNALETRLRIESEAAEARNKQREENERLRLQRLERKQDLDMQLTMCRDRKRREKEELLSIDQSQNQETLKLLQQDSGLLSRVMDRVQQTIHSSRKPTSIF